MKPPVKDVFYETQGEAYQRFKDQFQEQPARGHVKRPTCPQSFRVQLTDPRKYDVIASSFTGAPGVGKVQDQQQLLDQLFTCSTSVTVGAVGAGGPDGPLRHPADGHDHPADRVQPTPRDRDHAAGRGLELDIQLPFILETVIAAVLGAGLAIRSRCGRRSATASPGTSARVALDHASSASHDVVAIAPWVIGGVVPGRRGHLLVHPAEVPAGLTPHALSCPTRRTSPGPALLPVAVAAPTCRDRPVWHPVTDGAM